MNHLIEYATHLWSDDPVVTESRSHQVLRSIEMPDRVTYYAIPWAPLINQGKLNSVERLPKNQDIAFTICQHIRFRDIFPAMRRLGIDVVFTPHATRQDQQRDGIKALPYPHAPVVFTPKHNEKEFLFSFVGAKGTHWTRPLLGNLKGGYVQFRDAWHFNRDERAKEQQEFQTVFSKSVFALCPRGTGPGTLRFWEAVESLVIPVLIADDLQLPSGVNWNECIVQIPETVEAIESIPSLLASFSEQKISSMLLELSRVRRRFSGEGIVSPATEWIHGQQ